MKLETTNTPLETAGPIESHSFGIEINEYTFDLLIRKLYKNPVESIIRELVSNARDAHVAAGTTKTPITVNFPTTISPYFTVKDYGTGLSHADMINLYNMLCASNRRESNSFIGGFGLGSKSPFSYTDQFTVESRFHGVLRQYAVYRNAENIPTISLLNTDSTNEPNGLTVQIPVPTAEFHKWFNGVNQLIWFENINYNISPPTIPVVWSNNDYTLTEAKIEFNGYLYATVEGVNYKVDTSELFSDRVWSDRVNTGSWKASLFLHFPVGTLSITPNREDLIYNPHTIATLETAYEAAIRTITHDIQDRVNQCATYNDACKQTYQLRTRFSSITKNPPTFKHPSRPNEELSRFVYITIPDDTHIGHLKKVKYGRGRDGNLTHDGWQDKQELRIDLAAENTTLLWCPEKTPHLRERLKTLTARRNVLYLLLKGPNKDAIINLLTQELPQSFDIEDLSTIQYYQRPRTVATKKVPTLTGRITTSDIDPDRAFKVIKDPCGAIRYNDTTYTTYEIDYLRCTLDTFNDYQRIQDIVLLPDNAKNSKLAKQLTDFLPIAHGRIEALLAAHKETLIAYQLKEKVFGHAHIPYHWRYDQQRLDSPLFKGIRKYLTLNDDKPERLIHAARLLNLSSPSPSPTALEEAQTFYDKYKVFFETPIDLENAPILLTAYDFYLEHHTPC